MPSNKSRGSPLKARRGSRGSRSPATRKDQAPEKPNSLDSLLDKATGQAKHKQHDEIQVEKVQEKYDELIAKVKAELEGSENKNLADLESYPVFIRTWETLFDLGHPSLTGLSDFGLFYSDKNKEFTDTVVSNIVEGPKYSADLSKFGEAVEQHISNGYYCSETSVVKIFQAAFQNTVPYTCHLVRGLFNPGLIFYCAKADEFGPEFSKLLLELVKKLQLDRYEYDAVYPLILPTIAQAVEEEIEVLEKSKSYLSSVLEMFEIVKTGYLEERNDLVEKGIFPQEIRDDPDDDDDDDADEKTPWRAFLTSILENVTYSGSVQLYKKFTETQFMFLYDVVMTTEYPPVCVRSTDGLLCQCKIQALRIAAINFVFERVPGLYTDLLKPHANDMFHLYQTHPRIEVLRAYIQIYPQVGHDERFFDLTFRQLAKNRYAMQTLLFEYYKKVALVDPNRFEETHLQKLERFLEDRVSDQLEQTMELIVTIAEGNPKLFKGRGELYFEAIRNETNEALWFLANTILLCRATISESEASDAVQRLISQTHVIKATSYVVDVLEKLETIAYAYPKVVSKEMKFVEEKKKDPIYRKNAISVEQAVNQKANGSTSCTII